MDARLRPVGMGLLLTSALGVAEAAAQAPAHHHHAAPDAAAAAARMLTPADTATASYALRQVAVTNGVALTLSLTPPPPARQDTSATPRLLPGQDVAVRLVLRDSVSREPLSGQTLGAWIDRRPGPAGLDSAGCHERMQSYFQGTLQARPTIDLTSYVVLSLNAGNTLSVIDPFLGFGSTKLYTTVLMESEGEDWVLDSQRGRLFVTLPQTGGVAAISTESWKVERTLRPGARPSRVSLDSVGARLWVGLDGVGDSTAGGVAVYDLATLGLVTTAVTGRGHHELAFTANPRMALVTNRADGSVTVVDPTSLAVWKTVATGPAPVGVAQSALSGDIYVVHADGTVAVLDAVGLAVRSRFVTGTGASSLNFDPSGRWGFIVDPSGDRVFVLDAGRQAVRHVIPFGKAPDQIMFTQTFAYVRSSGTVEVGMISLFALDGEHPPRVLPFPAGERPPGRLDAPGAASAIAPAFTGDPHMQDAVYVPNAGDRSIYHYHYMEGMPTPSGRLDNYGFIPKAVLVVGRDMREVAPGVYRAVVRFEDAGPFAFLLALPDRHVSRCFDFEVAPTPRMPVRRPRHAVLVAAASGGEFPVGDTVEVRFRLDGSFEEVPEAGLDDLHALVSSPTGWNVRALAEPEGKGIYRVRVLLPNTGTYYVTVASRRVGLRVQDVRPLVISARPAGALP